MKYLLRWTRASSFNYSDDIHGEYESETLSDIKDYYQNQLKMKSTITNIKLISTQELPLDLLYENKTPYDGWGPLDS